jgi:hypothetical protein
LSALSLYHLLTNSLWYVGGAELELQWRVHLLYFVLGSSLLSLWTISVPHIFDKEDEACYRYSGFMASILAGLLALFIWYNPLTWKNSNRLLYSDLDAPTFDALVTTHIISCHII